MQEISLKALLKAGCHFGHRVTRWHPKAKDFIYASRSGIHIINLIKTKEKLEQARNFIYDLAKNGNTLLIVATKRQAKETIKESTKNSSILVITERWLGGLLTNWEQISKNIKRLARMEEEKASGVWNKYKKAEQLKLEHVMRKLEIFYGGIKKMEEFPNALYIIDIRKENLALREAQKKDIPTVAIVDTNSDPSLVSYPIPANDDAVGSIRYITQIIVEAYLEGEKVGKKAKSEKDTKKTQVKKEGKQEDLSELSEVEMVDRKEEKEMEKEIEVKKRYKSKKEVK